MGFAQAWGNNTISGPYTMASTGSVGAGSAVLVWIAEFFNGNFTTGVTDNQGNSYVRVGTAYQPVGGNCYMHCFLAQNVTGGAILTQTLQHSAGTYWVDFIGMEYNDLGTMGALDQYDVFGPAAGSPSNAPSVTAAHSTVNPNDHLVGCTWYSSFSASFTPGSGYTQREIQHDGSIGTSLAAMDQTVSLTGTYTANATLGSSNEWIQGLISLQIGGSTPPPPPQPVVCIMG